MALVGAAAVALMISDIAKGMPDPLAASNTAQPNARPAPIDKNRLAKAIRDGLRQQGRGADMVSCPGDLKGTVGTVLPCDLTDRGQSYGVTVSVTSVEGGAIHFTSTVDEHPNQ